MRFSRAIILGALLGTLSACAAEVDSSQSDTFSNCFQREIREQIGWCLAGAETDSFYRAAGRHQIIYGRYNDDSDLVKDGLSFCLTDQEKRSLVNACKPEEVLSLASEQLPEADSGLCEANVDPRTTPAGC